jgi:hypothetical protein
MNPDNFTAQIIGVFLAETVKNVAKGSANVLYNNFNLLFYSEITTLGLNDSTDAEEITKRLEAKPEVLEIVQQKLNAHPQLAEEMSKTIEASKVTYARDIFSSNVSSHNQAGGQTAHTINNYNPLPLLPETKIQIDLNYRLEQAFDELEVYRLEIILTNKGSRKISNYLFEIEFPRKYLNDSTLINFEVEDRATEEYRFFRITSESQNNPIYPDDRRIIFSPNYKVEGIVPYNHILRIKVYVDEQLVRTIEKPMIELITNN